MSKRNSESVARSGWPLDLAVLHNKFGQTPVVAGMEPDTLLAFVKFRLEFLESEQDELYKAFREKDPAGFVDAIIDWIVVGLGTLDHLGVDSGKAWDLVHSRNMIKLAGVNPERPNRFGFPDLIKPHGWTPPDHSDNVGRLGEVFAAAEEAEDQKATQEEES